jgi:hypothetical protein
MNPVHILVTLRYYFHMCVLGCAAALLWIVQKAAHPSSSKPR